MILDLEQGSLLWLEFRRTKVCASDAAIVLGASKFRTKQELWAEKCGFIDPEPENFFMKRGKELEEPARKYAEEMLDTLFLPEVRLHPVYDWMCASYDGISFDNKVLIEIKCPLKKANHAMAKEGKIPDYYMPQLQHQMAVGGFDECIYFSFDGKEGVSVNVKKDDDFISNMIEKEYEFYQCMINLTEPK
jgi:putative phage-type endonuclease